MNQRCLSLPLECIFIRGLVILVSRDWHPKIQVETLMKIRVQRESYVVKNAHKDNYNYKKNEALCFVL